jgi:hypothetical protein
VHSTRSVPAVDVGLEPKAGAAVVEAVRLVAVRLGALSDGARSGNGAWWRAGIAESVADRVPAPTLARYEIALPPRRTRGATRA